MQTQAPQKPRKALSIQEFCWQAGISRNSAYRMMGRGTLKTIRLGARRLVPVVELERLLSEGESANG